MCLRVLNNYIIIIDIEFEWDQIKAESNMKKHGVSFEDAKSAFYDDFADEFYDELNSDEEDRFLLLGKSWNQKCTEVFYER